MKTLRDSISTLLASWCEGLLQHQIDRPEDSALHGGLMCPDCGFVHGRCADALYPFLSMARQTGEPKWIEAAIRVQKWSDWVSQDDGSFVNDRPGNPWTGITVFGALALGEALHHHGEMLPASARANWTRRLEQAALWIEGVDWSSHGTINYPISTAAALASASQVLGEPRMLATARHWAHWARDFLMPDGLLFGEGQRTPTERGVYAVDAPYNLEESLPNLALYAHIAGDDEVRDLILRSFEAHLDFLLPDGSYDAGWSSRSFKWTLWGSRTSDGIAGLLPLARYDPRIAEAVRRNVEYLRGCTFDGLLYGGPHLRSQGRLPCIHHTFAHAKALAFALDAGHFSDERVLLPCDRARGIIKRDAIGTTFVSLGRWRASFTVSDVFYGARGSRASGGALTMLWHRATGPLCVSSMSDYQRIEPTNMASTQAESEISVLTPRLEQGSFSSELDLSARLEASQDSVKASGRLTNLRDETSGEFCIETRFEGDTVHFHVTGQGATFVLPIASPHEEEVVRQARSVEIRKPNARVVVESSVDLHRDTNRIFHFVPGVQAVRLAMEVPAEGVHVSLSVTD